MAVNKRLPMNGRLNGGTVNRCQPYFSIAANHSDFGVILPLFTQYSAIPIGMTKFRQNLKNSVLLIPWTRTTRVEGVHPAKYYFDVLFHATARLHLFLAS